MAITFGTAPFQIKPDCVLVTGAAGFLGRALCGRLALEARSVIGIDRAWWAGSCARPSHREVDVGPPVTRVTLDVRDSSVVSVILKCQPQVVFHLAGHAYAARSVAAPYRDFSANLATTVGFLEHLRRASFQGLLVLASSAAVYGEPAEIPLTEDSPVAPTSPYGTSKAACEAYARMYSRLFGFRVLSARLFSLYGPGQTKQVVFDTIAKATAPSDRVALLGNGSELRDFLFVEDAAAALVHLARRQCGAPSESVNVCSGFSVSIRDVAGRILDLVRGNRRALAFSGVCRVGDPSPMGLQADSA